MNATGTFQRMFRQGPLSVTLHAAAEPFLVVLLIASPFLFGFDNVGAATALSIVAGLAILLVAMSTCWRLSLVKVIPLVAHAMIDLGLGALLVASPFLFGFHNDSSAATAFFIVFGVAEILATLATRWIPGDQPDAARRGSRSGAKPAGPEPAGPPPADASTDAVSTRARRAD